MLDIEDGMGKTELGSYGGRYAKDISSQIRSPVPEAKAKSIAADFFGLDADKLEAEYTAENGTACFSFDGGSVCLDAEGNVLSLSSERSVCGDMDSSELERIARDFLASHGFGEMYLASSERIGSVQTMKFECVESNVRCISDSVRVSVAGDDGGIYAYDATEHVRVHGTYPAVSAAVSESAARAALPSALKVIDAQLCYAPADDENSVLCYGFDCTGSDGEKLLILVDAQSGRQFDVFLEAN